MRLVGMLFFNFIGISLCFGIPGLGLQNIWLESLLIFVVFLSGAGSGMLLFKEDREYLV